MPNEPWRQLFQWRTCLNLHYVTADTISNAATNDKPPNQVKVDRLRCETTACMPYGDEAGANL